MYMPCNNMQNCMSTFPLDFPSSRYTVYIMLRCRRKVVAVFISLTFLALLLLLLLYSLASIVERRCA